MINIPQKPFQPDALDACALGKSNKHDPPRARHGTSMSTQVALGLVKASCLVDFVAGVKPPGNQFGEPQKEPGR